MQPSSAIHQQTAQRVQRIRRGVVLLLTSVLVPLLSGCDAPTLRNGPLSFLASAGDESGAADLYGRVTQGDEPALAQLIERAKRQKDLYAAFYAGLAFDPNSPNRTVKPDASAAAAQYSAAFKLPAAKHNLALLLLAGVSYEPKDTPKSGELDQPPDPIKLLEVAANKRVESMLLLAALFEQGVGSVKPNAALAAQWYAKAVEHSKDRRAQTRLGIAYLEGRGVSQDASKGQELLLAAAKAGSSDAQYRLAFLDQRAVQAAQWLSVAAMTDSSHVAAATFALSKLSRPDQEEIKRRATLWVHAHQVRRELPAFSEPIRVP